MISPSLRLPIDVVRGVAEQNYGIEADIAEFPGYYGQNFRLDPAAGPPLVLKVARPGASVEAVEMEHSAAAHVATSRLELGVPLALPNRDGVTVTAVGNRLVHVLEYVPGLPWSQLGPADPDRLDRLGRLVGSLALVLEGFRHPAMDRHLDWDFDAVPTLGPDVACIEDPNRRTIAQRRVDRYSEHVAGPFERARRAVIHGDVNNDNVLVDDDGAIVGLVDFEMIGRAPQVAEVAVTVAYAMLGQDEPLAAARHVLTGYHSARLMQPDEVAMVMDLALARLAMSVSRAAGYGRVDPDNRHLDLNSATAWTVLEQLDGVDIRPATESL